MTGLGIDAGAKKPLVSRGFKRVVWSLYAVPITYLILVGAVNTIALMGTWAIVDSVVSIPSVLAMYFYIWDRRTLNPLIWRIYAAFFLVWQPTYNLVITPAVTHRPENLSSSALGIVVLSPLMAAVVLYASRWNRLPQRTPAVAPPAAALHAEAEHRGKSVLAVIVAFTMVAIIAITTLGMVYFGASQKVGAQTLYRTTTAPPAHPAASFGGASLNATECAQLRALFDKGDFDALDKALGDMKAANDADPSKERRLSEAFSLFTEQKDLKQLDAWVEHSPDAYQPYLARAEFHIEESWRKRGEDWAAKTTQEQFRGMESELRKCTDDVSEALSIDRKLPEAYVLRIQVANAQGRAQEERAAFDEGTALFPGSYQIYATRMHSLLPRWGGTYAEMDAVAKKAIAASPNDPSMYALYCQLYSDQADVFSRNKNRKAAIAAWTKALQYGVDLDALVSRGWAYYHDGDKTKALADADRYLALGGTSPDGQLLRAWALLELGRPAEAGAAIRTFGQIAPERKNDIAEWRRAAAYRLTHKGK